MSESYLVDAAGKILKGEENIGDLKIYLKFLTSLPVDAKSYCETFSLNEPTLDLEAFRQELDPVLAVHTTFRLQFKELEDGTFTESVNLLHDLRQYAEQSKEHHQTIADALQLVKSVLRRQDRAALAVVIGNLFEPDVTYLQEHINTSDKIIREIKDFSPQQVPPVSPGHSRSRSTSGQEPEDLTYQVNNLKQLIDSFNALPPSTQTLLARNTSKKVWVPFVGLVPEGLMETSRFSKLDGLIKSHLEKSVNDRTLVLEELTLHDALVSACIIKIREGLESVSRTVVDIQGVFRHVKEKFDALSIALEKVKSSSEILPDYDFKVETKGFEALSSNAGGSLNTAPPSFYRA